MSKDQEKKRDDVLKRMLSTPPKPKATKAKAKKPKKK